MIEGLLSQFLVVLVLIGAFIAAAVVYFGTPAKIFERFITTHAPCYFKTSVKFGGVSVGWRSVTISNFELGNPEGFTTNYLVRWSKVHVTFIRPFPPPVVLAVEMGDYEIMYEKSVDADIDGQSNLQELAHCFTGEDAAAPKKLSKAKPYEPFNLNISVLSMANGKACVHQSFAKDTETELPRDVKLPHIQQKDIGKDLRVGVTFPQVGTVIVHALVTNFLDGLRGAGMIPAEKHSGGGNALVQGLLDSLPALDKVLQMALTEDILADMLRLTSDKTTEEKPAGKSAVSKAPQITEKAEPPLSDIDKLLADAQKMIADTGAAK